MKKNKVFIIFITIIIFIFLSYVILNLFQDLISPKISYNFKSAPKSTGFALLNDNKVNGFKVLLGKTDSPKVPEARFEVKDSWLDFSLGTNVGESEFKKIQGGSTSVEVEPQQGASQQKDLIVWENVLPSVDIQYQMKEDGLKEDIILKDKTLAAKAVKEHELFTLPFYITLTNVVPRSDIDGDLTPLFMDSKTGEYRFHMEKPVLRDSKGAIAEVEWSLKPLDDSSDLKSVPARYLLVLELPRAWLYEKDRVYPVTMVSNMIKNTDKAFGK